MLISSDSFEKSPALTHHGHRLRSDFLLLSLGVLPMLPVLNARQRDTPETSASPPVQAPAATHPPVLVPVEIIGSGSDPQWVFVEVPVAAIPEPSLPLILTAAACFSLRRHRTVRR
jgi:hypothetical protein